MDVEFEQKFESEVKYLSLGENAYREVLQSSPTVNERLIKLQTDPKNVEARKRMLRAVLKLDYVLTEKDQKNDERSYDIQLVEEVRQIALDMVQTLSIEKQEKALEFIKNLGESPWLLFHLDKTGNSIADFFENTKQVIKGEDVLLTVRQMDLMEFVGRTHDICKLLGSLNAQIDPDHEIIYREIIGKHLEGKTFITHDGRKIVFDAHDVQFILGVVGLHEDIWREDGFAHQAESLKKSNDIRNPEVAIARGRTILHFVDIFGDAVRFQDGSLKIVDQDAFKARFLDLFRRHIKLPIVGLDNGQKIDWSAGKVFRPEWGEHGVAGLLWTFGLLMEEWGINVDPGLISAVKNGILQVLKEAEAAIVGVRQKDSHYQYTTDKPGNLDDLLLAIQRAYLDVETDGNRSFVDQFLQKRSSVRPEAAFIQNVTSDHLDPTRNNWESLLRTLQAQFPNENIYLEPQAFEIRNNALEELPSKDENGNSTYALYFGPKPTISDLSRFRDGHESPIMG